MPIASKAVSELVKKLITDNRVMIFSKSYCPYSNNTKSLLTENGIEFSAIELDIRKDGSEIQNHLAAISGQRTVPNVFANGHHVGGCDDTFAAFKTNRLIDMLNGPAGKFAEAKKEEDKKTKSSSASPAPANASSSASASAAPAASDDKAPI
ncbi:hypothetical protein IW140_001237 [Coemansia sp. RSA 1813]|nr:hypothetical protein EV178_001173 [Coemansia sp. RSA 1646]KAJ1772171.1 hypothetical protein LPJ74_001756 [Coemansia sp. RSA 1843]KAJ2091711.1 hypothetical protein IW138_001694 [Coemansia sp. RSA 986]KAJ2216886.1 hypothetical protein EV179_000920 [Coemansia sp. RSA 487]KAJ2571888.1 hypothetical protein IW140_001237 [Coemansia sp. RSA 1813]